MDRKTLAQTEPQEEQKLNQAAGISGLNEVAISDAPPSPVTAQELPKPQDLSFNKFRPTKKRFSSVYAIVFLALVILGGLIFVAWKYNSKVPRMIGVKGEVVWWGMGIDEELVSPLIKEYEEKNPNVKIKFVKQSPQDYRERLINALTKGEGPDIFRIHNSWAPMFRDELDTVPSSIMTSEEYTKTYYPIIASDMRSTNGYVGIPLEYDALTLFINEDIFVSAGKSPPATWDELRVLANELTTRDQYQTVIQSGVALGKTGNVDHWPEILAFMMIQNGVNMANPTGKVAEDAIKYYSAFTTTDRVWNDTLQPSTIAFSEGKLAMYLAPAWRANDVRKLNPNLRFRTTLLPQLRKDDPNAPDTSYATYWVEGVWKRSGNRDLAWSFLRFLSTKESLEKLFKNASDVGKIAFIYPRIDMSELLIDHPIAGSVVGLAPEAKSWYLASSTNDGPTGINTQLAKVFEKLIKTANQRQANVREALKLTSADVIKILSQYQIVSAP